MTKAGLILVEKHYSKSLSDGHHLQSVIETKVAEIEVENLLRVEDNFIE